MNCVWPNDFIAFQTCVQEGRGITTFPDGQVYQGAYKQGQRDGRGSITFAEVRPSMNASTLSLTADHSVGTQGAVYEGRFREDRIDGQGTIKARLRGHTSRVIMLHVLFITF